MVADHLPRQPPTHNPQPTHEIWRFRDDLAAAGHRAVAGVVLVVGVAQETSARRAIRAIAVAGAIDRRGVAVAPEAPPRAGGSGRTQGAPGAGPAAMGP